MPVIRVEMWAGRTVDQKRALVEVLSKETARIIGCDVESVYVIVEDVKKENWGAGGRLCSEKYPDQGEDDPGGYIMIHGQKNGFGRLAWSTRQFNRTDGCIAVSNSDMDEIWDAVEVGTPIEIEP